MPKNIDKNAFISSANAKELIGNSLNNAAAVSPLNDFGRYMTGSRAIIKISDKLFGFAFRVSFSIETEQMEIWTIDDYTPYELAPNRVKVSGTLSMFHIPSKGPTEQFVQANVLGHLFHKYITIRIEDQLTGNKIFETNRAQITSRNQTLTAGEISTIELSWKAVGWRDQITPFYPGGHDASSQAASPGEDIAANPTNGFGVTEFIG